MQIRMLGQVSGLRNGEPWPGPGGIIDLPDDEAILLVSNSLAVPVLDPERRVETAVPAVTPVEVRDAAKHVAAREALVGSKTAKTGK